MTYTAQALRKSLRSLGYRSSQVHEDFKFAAVDQSTRPVLSVDAAAFIDEPASYRTAALGVVRTSGNETASQAANAIRSLGAPFLVVIAGEEASIWTYTANGVSKVDSTASSKWELLLADRAKFCPASIRQIKAIQVRRDEPYTGSLFDPRTLYGIQANTQLALNEMLQQFLAHFDKSRSKVGQLSLQVHHELLFPLVFRLLAGKILIDRDDDAVASIDPDDPRQVVATVERLYSLSPQRVEWTHARIAQLQEAWKDLREGLYVRNIAADDLAFVYENTLITPEARKSFGTHSTPYSAADYVIRSLQLPDSAAATHLRVYEPFAGACVFLTAALRRFKEHLPQSWPVRKMHEHLVSHFAASEVDPFACEIAKLALVLADYPHHNGWRVMREDLFEGGKLVERIRQCDVLLSNPPFEDFDTPSAGQSIHKPVALLEAVIEAPPAYVGIVMPSGLSSHKVYQKSIRRICEVYKDVEFVKLPEGVFRHASVGAEMLIAQCRREGEARGMEVSQETIVRKSAVSRSDWPRFTQTLQTSSTNVGRIEPFSPARLPGLRHLEQIWEYLNGSPLLGEFAEVHRGLEWRGNQREASRSTPATGYKRGLHHLGPSLTQFEITGTVYLDIRPSNLRGGAIDYPWSLPKVICNAVRCSRGPWRLEAAVDRQGLLVSQQFFGVWLRDSKASSWNLVELCAILNSPLANAFSFAHDEERGLRVTTMHGLPLPRAPISRDIENLVAEYIRVSDMSHDGPLFASRIKGPADILLEIDALVLRAYDLPPRLERELLRFMGGSQRPCRPTFAGYPGTATGDGAIPLYKRLAMCTTAIQSAWRTLAEPLPQSVANVFEIA